MSNKHEKELTDLLCSLGGELIRQRKHRVYRLRNGKTFTLPHSPSDQNWARIAKSELRRLAAETVSFDDLVVSSVSETTVREERYRHPNSEQHDRGEVTVFAGNGQPGTTHTPDNRQRTYRNFTSLEEVRDSLCQVDGFWELGPCGRAKVLMKIIGAFQPYLTAIPILLQPISRKTTELAVNMSRAERNALWMQLFENNFEACGGYFLPALLIDDPKLDHITIVDSSSLNVVSHDLDDVVLLDIRRPKGRLLVGRLPVAGEIDSEADFREGDKTEVVLFWGFREVDRKKRIDFPKDAEWFNAPATRAAVKALLETDASR